MIVVHFSIPFPLMIKKCNPAYISNHTVLMTSEMTTAALKSADILSKEKIMVYQLGQDWDFSSGIMFFCGQSWVNGQIGPVFM
ncbi:MAG: hypothetical protein D6698_06895 [Gammaproteobacteria bacterium]|nr:MAG: hypothetical protein D6698_06895 [Gammaproteobacteria bacterium]